MAKILVLEDMAAFRRMLTHILNEEGHTVSESDTGEIAYDAHSIANADIMITDLNMPWVNGVEAIIAARKQRPNLKIIAMSGGSVVLSTDYLSTSLLLGADAILHKPFEPEEMLKQVRHVLAA